MRIPSLVCLTLFSTPAFAGGFYTADTGALNMARGGAFIAAPDKVIALHMNPSGLSLLKGLHFEASMQTVFYNMEFRRSCPCLPADHPNREMAEAELAETFGTPATTNNPQIIPFLGLAYGLDFLDLTVAFGVWGPTSGKHSYGALPAASAPSFPSRAVDQPGRYSGLEVDTVEANFALGLSLSPLEGLRLGATAFIFQVGNNQTVHLWANVAASRPEDPARDVPTVLDFNMPFGLGWQVGAAYDIPYVPGRLTLGAAFRGKRDVRADGTIQASLSPELSELASVQGEDIIVELQTAPILRTGIQYAYPGLFAAEVAFVWEGWSKHDRIVIKPQNIVFETSVMPDPIELPQIVVDRRWKDTWSLRVGGQIDLFAPYLGIRAGYFYEPSAIPDFRVEPSRVDLDKHGMSLGLATTWYGFTFELSANYIALATATVTNSEVQVISPLPGDENNITTVANGTYKGQHIMLGLSLSFALDPLLESLSDDEDDSTLTAEQRPLPLDSRAGHQTEVARLTETR